jgi:hypothetical protein
MLPQAHHTRSAGDRISSRYEMLYQFRELAKKERMRYGEESDTDAR